MPVRLMPPVRLATLEPTIAVVGHMTPHVFTRHGRRNVRRGRGNVLRRDVAVMMVMMGIGRHSVWPRSCVLRRGRGRHVLARWTRPLSGRWARRRRNHVGYATGHLLHRIEHATTAATSVVLRLARVRTIRLRAAVLRLTLIITVVSEIVATSGNRVASKWIVGIVRIENDFRHDRRPEETVVLPKPVAIHQTPRWSECRPAAHPAHMAHVANTFLARWAKHENNTSTTRPRWTGAPAVRLDP